MAGNKPFNLLMVEDDDDDWLLVKEAFEEEESPCKSKVDLRRLNDGLELLDYLGDCMEGKNQKGPTPDLVLLDLNMPRMDGRETLKKIKAHPSCRGIPIVVFTTSAEQADVIECYQCGGSSFIQKPHSFEGLKEIVRALSNYWICTVEKVNHRDF